MKVYLAGPDVFRKDPIGYGKLLKDIVAAYGYEGLYPMDNEVEFDRDAPKDMALKIFLGNVDMLNAADIVLANISPFRGPGMDAGTAWEIGHASAQGKKIFLYSDMAETTYFRRADIAIGSRGVESFEYPSIEDFGLNENLMITHSAFDGTVHSSFTKAVKAMVESEKKQ